MFIFSRLSVLAKVVLVLILFGCFVGEMWQQFRKFTAQDTTQVVTLMMLLLMGKK